MLADSDFDLTQRLNRRFAITFLGRKLWIFEFDFLSLGFSCAMSAGNCFSHHLDSGRILVFRGRQRNFSTPGGFSFFAGVSAIFGALSVALWRGKRGFWLRLLSALCGIGVGGPCVWIIWNAFTSLPSTIKFALLRAYLMSAAPLIWWALALVFFALLMRPNKAAQEKQSPLS